VRATSSGLPSLLKRHGLRELLGPRRQDLGFDLSRRDRVHPDSHRPQIMRHLPCQRRERRLRRGIGCTGKGMHPRSGDRGDVDDRPFRRSQFLYQPAREHHRGEEVHVKHLPPGPQVGRQRVQPYPAFSLRRYPGVVDQRLQPSGDQPPPDLGHRLDRVVRIGEVDLDMIVGARFPGTILRERMARAGDHPPTGRGEPLDGCMPDAPARPGQKQRLALRHRRAPSPVPPGVPARPRAFKGSGAPRSTARPDHPASSGNGRAGDAHRRPRTRSRPG
jgi:hypothetical protein